MRRLTLKQLSVTHYPSAGGESSSPPKSDKTGRKKVGAKQLFWLLRCRLWTNNNTVRVAGTMGSKITDKKRKSRDSESESDDELANGLFDGILSQSEDEEDYLPSDDDDDVEDSENEGTGASEDDDDDDDDDILSDDIPSDVDSEEAINRLVKQQEELEITEPGVDPKREEDDGADRNYRIEKDANGGERYVYECVPLLEQTSFRLILTRC